MKAQITGVFDGQMDVFSTSARVLDDGVIDPRDTRSVLSEVLAICREAEARTPAAHAVLGRAAMSGAAMKRTPFFKILIANRGEIALRIMRTARRLGYGVVAVYSDADRDALHVREADQAVRIGEALPAQSYLRIDAIIAAAKASGASAVHPGYGFLAENEDFAQACRDAGLVFIGPSPEAIRAMGNKAGAKDIMQKAGVPCVPGYQGADQSDAVMLAEAKKIGFPVMIKAVGRWRRARHAAGRGRRAHFRTRCAARARRRRARSAIPPSSWSAPSSIPATSKSRCSATATATPFISASAIARCSAGTRS